jgi:hypothetical protein
MTEPIDADRDPLILRASAALRSRTHATDAARGALVRALNTAPAAPRARYRVAIGIAAGIVAVAGLALARFGHSIAATALPSPNTTVVEFSFDAPAARLVSVVGEFNGWNSRAAPMRRAANGRWVTDLALAPGRHTYGFEVDGDGLVPDPGAPVAPEQLFGVRHSVLLVSKGAKR